jgi:branched-chain amino acid transport system ATP-binding protein
MRLAVEEVHVAFDGVKAINGVDLALERGEILGLIGPNGAGKTTLVNVLSGFQRPSGGRVTLDGKDITLIAPQRRLHLGLARTFQGGRLFSHLTVHENVMLGAIGKGIGQRQASSIAWDMLDRLGMAKRAGAIAGGLPHGEERKVGIARALASKPVFLLLDEPAAGLDDDESAELVDALKAIRDSFEVGVLLIEHNVWLVMTLCDRAQVLDQGRTLATGTPDSVRNDPRVIEAYLGAPPAEVPDA